MEKDSGALYMCGSCSYFKKAIVGEANEGYCSNRAIILPNQRKVYTSTDASMCIKNGAYKKC